MTEQEIKRKLLELGFFADPAENLIEEELKVFQGLLKAQHIKDNARHALEIQKLQGEIERLKKEISVIEFAAKSGLGHTLDQAVSEAVKAERKRIRGLSKCTVQDSDCFTGDKPR